MTHIILTLILTVVPTHAISPLAAAMVATSTIPSTREQGHPRCWRKLERVPGGCEGRFEAIADHFRRSARSRDLDPYVLAAMAYRESRFNAAAVGSGGERGVLQLHPARADARRLRFFRDRRYRERCLEEEVDACQGPVVELAATILRRSLEICGGSLREALAMYNAGTCDHPRGLEYADRVMRSYVVLRELAERAQS